MQQEIRAVLAQMVAKVNMPPSSGLIAKEV